MVQQIPFQRCNQTLELVLIVAMNRKLDRSPSLSPPASGDELTKLCLICEAIPNEDVKSCYYVFVLDPAEASADGETDGHSFTTTPNREPTLRFDGLDRVTFCVFKSTLYIFEYEDTSPVEKYERDLDVDLSLDNFDEDYDMDVIAPLCQRKSVYSYDLPQSDSSSEMLVVQKSDLHKLPDMFGLKVFGNAVVTPGGKILVYSMNITTDIYYLPDLFASFELYDPDTGEWRKLPEIVQKYREVLNIFGAGFLSSSRFLVSTKKKKFVLDLDNYESGWNEHNLVPPIYDFYPVGVVEGEEVYFSYGHFKKARDWTTLSVIPNLSSFPPDLLDDWCYGGESMFPALRPPLFGVVDTADADGCCLFCAARVLIHRDSDDCLAPVPFVILDVFRGRPGHQLEWSGSIKFCSKLGDLFELMFSGVYRVSFNC